jgi:polyisoprenoid-binding protein YceI
MLKRLSLLLSVIAFIYLPAQAQWKTVKLISVSFKIKNAGIGVDGTFKKVNAQINIDEANPSKSSFVGSAEVGSISTGIKLRDSHLKEKPEFFNQAQFPSVVMKSVGVQLKSAGLYTVTWDLTIRGITRRFSSDVLTKVQGDQLSISTEFRINRNDWKLGGSSITMGDFVTVRLNSTLSK